MYDVKKNIKWIAPEEIIDSGGSTFVDDYFAHEEFYERTVVDSFHLGSDKLRSQVKILFGNEKLL